MTMATDACSRSSSSAAPASPPSSTDTAPTTFPDAHPFRVVIVGGGVAGIVLSHALVRAGIDHVVLEKGIIAPEWGASISIWAHGARILSQINCWDALCAHALPLKMIYARGADGKAYSEEPYFDMMKERNGFDYLTMERKDFLRIIYEQHPDKSKIKTGKRVVDVIDDEEGVKVILQDGTCEQGDILLGCDGVHSTVRELMWSKANASIPNYISASEKTSLKTTYRSLVGVAKPIPGLGERDMHWITHSGLSVLILTQPDKTFFFVNFKLEKPICWPHKAKWDDAAAQEAAESVAGLYITESVVFSELWKNRIRAHLIGLQEGVFDHWHFGRVGLVGDSVHKVTPNLALGAMCALEGCAVLVNEITELQGTLQPDPTDGSPGKRRKPTRSEVAALFRRYEEQRKPRQAEASEASALLTRLHAYDGWSRWAMMRLGVPLFGQAFIADTMAALCVGAPKFRFLPVDHRTPGTYAWEDEPSYVAAAVPRLRDSAVSSPGVWAVRNATLVDLSSLVLMLGFLYLLFGSGFDGMELPVDVRD